ncbi:MAG: hypothetical protein KatS3mg031_0600 [Chitinophagales bacterium]|nr:MAG: hypothetical protein KatS3mg031_0600 [Chitinophagales bacterium]
MKQLILLLAFFCLVGGLTEVQGQAFRKGDTYLSLGTGGSNFWHIVSDERYLPRGTYTGITFQVNLQMEFSIHEYVGIGFTTGFGVGGAGYYYRNSTEFNVPFGFIGNFHFLQLIADKTGKSFADKLDVYGGVNVGSGFAVFTTPDAVFAALVFAGPHVGIRYFFHPSIAVNGELGYGKHWINGGLTFKLNK